MQYCCVHCGSQASALVIQYGPKNYALAQCPACSKLVDPYVEDSFTLKLIDLLLMKQSIHRHLLFNLSEPSSSARLPVMARLLVSNLLLDACPFSCRFPITSV